MSSFFVSPRRDQKQRPPAIGGGERLSFFSNCGSSVATRVIGPASVVGKNETDARYAR